MALKPAVDFVTDEAELKEIKEESVKVAVRKHESALMSEQSKIIDLQTLLDSREEVGYSARRGRQPLISAMIDRVIWGALSQHCPCSVVVVFTSLAVFVKLKWSQRPG